MESHDKEALAEALSEGLEEAIEVIQLVQSAIEDENWLAAADHWAMLSKLIDPVGRALLSLGAVFQSEQYQVMLRRMKAGDN